MRLSEFSGSIALVEAIHRCRLRGTITIDEEREICKDIKESIKGNNTVVKDFIDINKTELPIINNPYFPISVTFLFGMDKIEIEFADNSLIFIGMKSDNFIYTDSKNNHTFPPTIGNSAAEVTTFHCKTQDESKQLRSVIRMTFGDCDFSEHKI